MYQMACLSLIQRAILCDIQHYEEGLTLFRAPSSPALVSGCVCFTGHCIPPSWTMVSRHSSIYFGGDAKQSARLASDNSLQDCLHSHSALPVDRLCPDRFPPAQVLISPPRPHMSTIQGHLQHTTCTQHPLCIPSTHKANMAAKLTKHTFTSCSLNNVAPHLGPLTHKVPHYADEVRDALRSTALQMEQGW